ncbi:MAG: hypothetical protein NTY90_02950 [Candidatus Micrarchaeota archaeon]|nr:hypothetical protein [Candidatus Micrarchaeota archaeon]
MAELSNKIIAVLLGFLMVTYLISTWMVLNKFQLQPMAGGAFSTSTSGIVSAIVPGIVSISLVSALVNFSTINATAVKDSHTDAVAGQRFFTIENDGTVVVNVSACSTELWIGSSKAPSDYNITVENNKTGSALEFPLGGEGIWGVMNTTASACGGAASGSGTRIAGFLDYTDTNDTINVFIQIHVPSDEPPGTKAATVTFTADYG